MGGALGYFVSSLAASVLYRLELATPVTVFAAVTLLAVAGLSLIPGRTSSESSGGAGFLGATMGIALVVVAVPFGNIGADVADGTAYRAYFSADLMTHLSVVAELQKGVFPPENPFYRGDTLGYYWLFFTFPASVGKLATNQSALVITYLASGILFAGLLFSVVRRLGASPVRAFAGAGIILCAVSFEGLVALTRSERWTDLNVDALSRWVFELTSLDGLHRSLLYTPQHLFSYSLLLVLILMIVRGEPSDTKGAVLVGVLLGGMAGTSIVTAMLAGPWLVLVLWVRRKTLRFWTTSVTATLTSLLFLSWYVVLGFFDDAGGALILRTPRLLELPSILLLDLGALCVLLFSRRRSRLSGDRELVALTLGALTCVLFVDIRGYEGVWMAWRAGSVLLIALGLAAVRELRPVHALVVVPALATMLLDVVNAADVTNRRPSPGGFPWTTVVRTDEGAALDWIRRETPVDAVVQWDVRARDLGEWALIPALAERRMAVGFPIFLLDRAKYRVRERRHVRPIFVSGDPAEAHRLALEQGIDWILLGASELRARGDRLRPLYEHEEGFRVAFEQGEVSVLEVRPP